MTDVGEQSLRLILEPLLITKEEEDDHHRRAKQVVVEIILENTEFDQSSYDEGHMHSFTWRLTPLSVLSFMSLSPWLTSVIEVQLPYQRSKPWEAFSPCVVASGFNIVIAALQELQ